MSRHRIVKNLDLDDELEDYDGGDGYDQDTGVGDMTEEDKERMKNCVMVVQSRLQPDFPTIPEEEIVETLWYYYYDIEQSISWLRSKHSSKPKKTKKPSSSQTPAAGQKSGSKSKSAINVSMNSRPMEGECSTSSARDFFIGTPWLNLPSEVQGEILVEPLYPFGGLLGGASTKSGGGKSSKLAALAAARRKKEQEKRERSTPLTNTNERQQSKSTSGPSDDLARTEKSRTNSAADEPSIQDDKSLVDNSTNQCSLINEKGVTALASQYEAATPQHVRAPPSKFAATMFGADPGLTPLNRLSSTFYTEEIPRVLRTNLTEYDAFVGPSPDDVVTAAQTSKGSKTGKTDGQRTNGDTAVKSITNELKSVSVEESPRAKSKNIDVLAEYRKVKGKDTSNFVVIGHVDHGKSTLMGRLLFDLNVVNSRTIDKYRKEAEKVGKSSFALAWVLDQTSEERDRGVTMDIATNQFETEKTKFTILDAPGHRDFIPNMIAGASQADFAVLVIDGSPNAFESGLKGQTKEHALLVRSIGVQRIIVAVNKLDLVAWSHERFEEVQQQTTAFLTVAGFQPKNVSFVPCSGLTGDNVTRKAQDDRAAWYSGPTLVELLETSEPTARALEKPLRMTVGDIFRGGVVNPLSVSGRLDAGSLQVGDAMLAMPARETAYIKGIEIDQETRDWAVAGQIATLHLTDIDSIHLKTGDVLCPPTSPIQNITSFTTKILAFEHVTPMSVDVLRGRLQTPGRISQLIATLDKATGAVTKKKPKILQPGSVARIVVETNSPVPLEAPARIVLRANGETVAAGLLE
ncbi:MAG: Hsp70 suppressor, GTPase facilitates ribosomal subunit dissociation [Piccolia ochrophora]|nr:MAG: Hsp70 suppressor, GTPase facilitates ribosomal subunit dissociation [Piccolia ochrophora]